VRIQGILVPPLLKGLGSRVLVSGLGARVKVTE
jgi:hypothetical protein